MTAVIRPAAQAFDLAKANPRPTVRWPADPRQFEPAATEARSKLTRHDADAILAECRKAANGDWDRWQRHTEPYRAALKSKVGALKALDPVAAPWLDAQSEPLAGKGGFPLFEVAPRAYLKYLYEPECLDPFRKDRSVVAVHRWLRARGIELIFVPVPKMTEVYVEHFVEPCPGDGIIAPHVRRTLFELLNDGVEVVDGFPLFRSLRDNDTEYLYNTADSHWAPRGMRIMAKEVADRIARYKFGSRARYALPIVKTAPGFHPIPGKLLGVESTGLITSQYAWSVLTPAQQELATAAQTTCLAHVTMLDDREPPDDAESPVLLVGNSYVPQFREQLIKELNLLVQTRWQAGATTQVFGDLLREPSLLDHCRVIVWVTADQHMADFKPLPAEIAAAAHSQ